jgi:glycosyltransferase involved in cell wall biosynthesis
MSISLNIFIFCYNEKHIISETIRHYRTLFPGCKITILDNMSTDGSPMIARQLGCNVKQFNTGGHFDDYKHRQLRNECWKMIQNQWVIVCDMDEWLCITKDELLEEDRKGTTVLTVHGYDIIGESQKEDLSDINLHRLYHGVPNGSENKPLCFKPGPIKEMFFEVGGHYFNPIGSIVRSEKQYILKHMNILGLPFKLYRNKLRYDRSHKARAQWSLCVVYAQSVEEVTKQYYAMLEAKQDLSSILEKYVV